MKTHTITFLPGDGIGPEVLYATERVLAATGIRFYREWHMIGEEARRATGRFLPEATARSIRRNRVAIKGPTETPTGGGHRSLNVRLREKFGLYANIRPVHTMPGIVTRFSDVPVDIVVFRENVEGEYVGPERLVPGGAESVSRFTKEGCRRIAEFAFRWAYQHHRKKVTIVHKANIIKKTHGLFLHIAREVAKDFPGIECTDLIVDNCFMQVVMHPERFDCLLLPNLLGDIASDLCAGLVGGLGVAPGANFGDDVAIFEAVHGTAPDIVGKGIANPTALMLSGAMMLEYLGEEDAAKRLRNAIDCVLREGSLVSPDGRVVSTSKFTEAVVDCLR